MGELEDTFGAEFAEKVQQRTQERRAEREKISEETARTISHLVINEEQFGEGDPMFTYSTDEGVQHDVLLMQLGDPASGSIWSQVRELESGAVSVPLDYLGQWVWSIFNDPSMARQMEEDQYYIVVGRLDEWEREDGTTQDQMAPVRGVIGLEQAKELASEALEAQGFAGETEEVEPEPEEEEVGGILASGSDSEEEEPEEPSLPVTYSDVANVVEHLGEEEEEVWEVTEDHEELDTLLTVVCGRLDGVDYEDEDHRREIKEMSLDRISEGPPEEETTEETEEDRLFG